VPEGEIEALRDGREPRFDDPDAALIFRFSRTFYETRDVPDELFKETVDRFGRRTVVELVGVLGYYSMLAIALRVFRVPAIGAD
jgi:4-carboxymuconolactone decarboxylase